MAACVLALHINSAMQHPLPITAPAQPRHGPPLFFCVALTSAAPHARTRRGPQRIRRCSKFAAAHHTTPYIAPPARFSHHRSRTTPTRSRRLIPSCFASHPPLHLPCMPGKGRAHVSLLAEHACVVPLWRAERFSAPNRPSTDSVCCCRPFPLSLRSSKNIN